MLKIKQSEIGQLQEMVDRAKADIDERGLVVDGRVNPSFREWRDAIEVLAFALLEAQ